jgi:hypothetical protein
MATSVALGTDSLVDPPALGWIAAAPGSAVPNATGAVGERRQLVRWCRNNLQDEDSSAANNQKNQ